MSELYVTNLLEEYEFVHINKCVDIEGKRITVPDLNRPALQLAGYFDYFDSERIQIVGMVEYTYLEKMTSSQRKEVLGKMFSYEIPVLILCRDFDPYPEMLETANFNDVPIIKTDMSTSDVMAEVTRWLKVKLAPYVTKHGVLVDIFGEGVLIMGESGIGKSETALELIKRGHRLVADDAVEIKKASQRTLVGSSPEVIRYFIELRGIGIIDVKQMFGVESVKATQNIDLVIILEVWDNSKEYDRLGLTEEYISILGNKVVCHRIPIRPGRNLAVICESAAINHRQKKMGYNAAKSLNERVLENMKF
ncbi:MAG: HPr(Ser) kinase/phosphatase [Lachnospirales bacterium]